MDVKVVREETIPTLMKRLNAKDSEDKKLKKACTDFEAVFMGYMLKTMRKTVPHDDKGAMGNQKEIYDSMFDQQLTTQISQSKKSFGIGEAMYRQLSRKRHDEEANTPPVAPPKK